MPTFEVSLLVNVEADTLDEAVEEAREDLARYARRGQVNVVNADTGERWAADTDGVRPQPSNDELAALGLLTCPYDCDHCREA